MSITYGKFKEINNAVKMNDSNRMGKVLAVRGDVCRIEVSDNISDIYVQQLIEDIVYNGTGCISNPSILKNWKGWAA